MRIHKATMMFIMALVLFVGQATFQGQAVAGSSDGCVVTIRNDIHMAPAAELATTKGYPDIVTLENSLIQVSSVPNRGRLIFDYVHKSTGHSEFYTNTSPMPIKDDRGYFLEFGGYYASHPWNARSNQPYDLEYDIVKETPEECAIRIHKKDPETAIGLECVIAVRKNDPSVYLEIKLINSSDKDQTIDFFDRAVVSSGEEMNDKTRVVLPQGIDAVTIGKSADGWMGGEGEGVSWPQPWQEWGAFKGEGHFHVNLTKAKEFILKVYDPESKESFAKEWSAEAPYQKVEISSWGPAYEDTFGAYPGFTVTTIVERLLIPSGESKRFELKFYASKS